MLFIIGWDFFNVWFRINKLFFELKIWLHFHFFFTSSINISVHQNQKDLEKETCSWKNCYKTLENAEMQKQNPPTMVPLFQWIFPAVFVMKFAKYGMIFRLFKKFKYCRKLVNA